ncbi:hypothetical protein BOX15_Mlig019450g1 [Macrostomum lignano]|uniref:Nuclear receptor domain-containing protein n=1 Tax=Macrostomum lignano TaxID=282301 RepID=A0A267FB40_9PLAT|nr:hypothetical protein BOX15_Mlig019450g1 [Macrostomum lignano]
MSLWDSDPNCFVELEEVTDDIYWPQQVQHQQYQHQQYQHQQQNQHQQPARRSRQPVLSGDAECLVCQLAASGNNFGVATCESCKTFFRRNAKREPSQIRCLHYNNCNVLREYRRSCTACRLRKCFAVGMRKELILSDEKLRSRARPTFKKPRYRWCRIPASVDINQLLAALPLASVSGSRSSISDEAPSGSGRSQSQPSPPHQLRVKEEAADFADADEDDEVEEEEESPSEPELSPDSKQLEASPKFSVLSSCVREYREPQDRKSAGALLIKILYLEDGFACMDNPIRKMIRLIPQLPYFDQLDKALLGRIVKFRVFGALQIISQLNYEPDRDAWVYSVDSGRPVLDEAVIPARDGVYSTFMCLTKRCLTDGRALYTPADVERMYNALIGFYREMQRLFRERCHLAAVVLMALYLLEEDVPLALTDAEKSSLRQVQWNYLNYLDDIAAGSCKLDGQVARYTSKKALLLLVQIRWLDTCYSDAAKALELAKVPPLMQELVSE